MSSARYFKGTHTNQSVVPFSKAPCQEVGMVLTGELEKQEITLLPMYPVGTQPICLEHPSRSSAICE